MQQLKRELHAFALGKPPQYIQQWLDGKFQRPELRDALKQLAREYCRNCLFSGKGVISHSFSQCKSLGNKCVLPCPKCVQAGRVENIYHWLTDCPGN